MDVSGITFEWRGAVRNAELNRLHADAFGHDVHESDWEAQIQRHSLGWVCARRADVLVGFVNVVWDGSDHAFLLDTIVAKDQARKGIGTELVNTAALRARESGIRWLHVDFESHLAGFYFDACGFRPTSAGLIDLAGWPVPRSVA